VAATRIVKCTSRGCCGGFCFQQSAAFLDKFDDPKAVVWCTRQPVSWNLSLEATPSDVGEMLTVYEPGRREESAYCCDIDCPDVCLMCSQVMANGFRPE
jgi:hypothetical protein